MDTITRGKHLPDFTDEEVWRWFGERGVYSASVEQFKSCFDVFEHRQGVFTYRLKPREEKKLMKSSTDSANFFSGITLHDPMETLILREYGDKINRIHTHYLRDDSDEIMKGEEIDVIEN